MEIVHFAPYGPYRAGIYEAARDMVRADVERGHHVSFVDVGPTNLDGRQEQCQHGAVDDRGGFRLVTLPHYWATSADLLIYHTGVNDNWVVGSQAPIIVFVHGRPLATFREEQSLRPLNGYTLLHALGDWPRIKRFVYFWPEFTAYWRNVMPEHKLAAIDWPPVDRARFLPEGPTHQYAREHRGRYNAIIADAWRMDVDCFEIANGAIEAAKRIPGLKVHFYSVMTAPDNNLPGCWSVILNKLAYLGALGEINGRVEDMDARYRAADFVLSPNRIVTRVIGEALSCGVPVLAPTGCKVTNYLADVTDPVSVGKTAAQLVRDLEADREQVRREALATAERFNLDRYGEAIERVYREVVP